MAPHDFLRCGEILVSFYRPIPVAPTVWTFGVEYSEDEFPSDSIATGPEEAEDGQGTAPADATPGEPQE
jgi:hypothetical protein